MPSSIACRVAAKKRELLTHIAPMLGGAVLAVGVVFPACLPGMSLAAAVTVGLLYLSMATLECGARVATARNGVPTLA